LSNRDPLRLVQAKTGTAAVGLVILALVTGSTFPTVAVGLVATIVGAVGYGLSIVLDVRALRLVGAAREAAMFATAPFVGAIVAMAMFSEHLTLSILGAGLLMGAAVVAFTRETHS